jgi:diguanylate cyclase (GGDEF)-like protein/PAS domain S-box-containing protein
MKKFRSLWTQPLLPIMTIVVGMAVSGAAAYTIRAEIQSSTQLRFQSEASDIARQVEKRFGAYVEVLVGLRALFNTSEDVSRVQFHRYVEGLNINRNFPGFQVLNFAPYVGHADREAFEAAVRRDTSMQRDGYPRFRIQPAGERAGYYPLTYLEPMAGNEPFMGKDMGSIPAVKQVLEWARDTGGLASSGKVIQTNGPDSHVGLAMRLPVYRAGLPIDTVEQRRAAYLGSVGAGFRVAVILQDLVRKNGMQLRMYDGGTALQGYEGSDQRREQAAHLPAARSADTLLFDSAASTAERGAAHDFAQTFALGGRHWVVQVSSSAAAATSLGDRLVPWAILIGGTLISLLLAGILHALNSSRSRALGIARAMTRNLRLSKRRLADAQRMARVGSWTVEARTGAVQCSREAKRIYGLEQEGAPLTLEQLLTAVPDQERDTVQQVLQTALVQEGRGEVEHRIVTPQGEERWVHVIAEASRKAGSAVLNGTVRDRTASKKEALRLTVAHDVARALSGDDDLQTVMTEILRLLCTHFDWDTGAYWSLDRDGLTRCAHAWAREGDTGMAEFVESGLRLSYRPGEGSLGRVWSTGEPVWIESLPAERSFSRESLAHQAGLAALLVVPLGSGQMLAALEFFSRRPRAFDQETMGFMRSIGSQVGQYLQRKQAEKALRFVASHDALTGLANRVLLRERLAHAIKRGQRFNKRLAVLFVDLDRFKFINDTLGHTTGDTLLRYCAQRIVSQLRDTDTVARFGGDEFVILIEDMDEPSDALAVVNKILQACAQPFNIEDRELHVSASVGLAVYPEDGADTEALLKNADAAMYRAKEKGRATYQFYSAQMQAQGTERFMLEAELRRAQERGELFLLYQPKMDIATHRITGVEALMRWRHPSMGLISPAQFIPIAEETGLIDSIGRWALEVACADARRWERNGQRVQVSVNLAARQLNRHKLVEEVADALKHSGLDPSLLELEITESGVMQNPNRAASLLQEIRALGVSLAIDDFGTGYSSLSYLKRFPLTTLKIDRSFIKDLPGDGDGAALTGGIIGLAHGLRMKVVAEGVETAAQLGYLRSHQCDEMQGFLLSKPISPEEIGDFLTRDLRSLVISTVPAAAA